MTLSIKATALSALLLATESRAFAPGARFGVPATHTAFRTSSPFLSTPLQLRAVKLDQEHETAEGNEADRLRSMAAKLRAEAASLEAEQENEKTQAAQKAFQKFDNNKDGEVTLEELKAGLEKAFKMDLPQSRVQDLMQTFDKSGDGALQLEEFVDVEKFRNQLEQLDRQEKAAQREAAKKAQQEAQAAEEAETRLAVIKESINEKAPTNTEKVLSVLPFLLPLMDGLPFGRFLLESHLDNPLVMGLAGLFGLYRAIPLSGFIAYGVLAYLRENPAVNKQIRFNAGQAFYLDIALFVPAVLTTLIGLAAGATGGNFEIPAGVSELGQDAVFVTLLLSIGYSAVSSLLGATPDKIPFISDAVSKRMISTDMFDDEGRFIQPEKEDDKKED